MFNYRSRSISNGNLSGLGRDGATTVQTIGALLRDRREVLGATLAEIEAATKIRQKYLSALETDEWQLLPGEIIGRGFLRNYASYLGLDPAELTERRRAIVDPSVITILSNTSAGTQLPPERDIDYRPRIMDLREDADVIEGRAVQVGPYLRALLSVLLVALLGWGLWQYGGRISSQATSLYRSMSERVMIALAVTPAPTSTPTPRPTATPLAITPIATEANNNSPEQPTSVPAPNTQPGTPADASLNTAGTIDILPTATNTPEPTATPPATPTPVPLGNVTNVANLRSGPGTNFPVVGSLQPGDQVQLTGVSPDGLWYSLDGDRCIFAQLVTLVNNAPATLSIAQAGTQPKEPQAPEATVTQTPEPPAQQPATQQPEAQPPVQQPAPPVISAAVCNEPGAAITSPGENQTIGGAFNIAGVANRDPFQYYKIEVNGLFIVRGDAPVAGGTLATLDTTIFSNGPASILLTSIDQSGNFSVCAVNVVVQN